MSKQFKINIVGQPSCPYCIKAKDTQKLLKNISLTYQNVDDKTKEELKLKHNYQTIPMIFIDGNFLGGYDDLLDWITDNSEVVL